MQDEEKNVQDKLRKQKMKKKDSKSIEKDW
jgi:hypothetical protein